jgi:hypothetical protein
LSSSSKLLSSASEAALPFREEVRGERYSCLLALAKLLSFRASPGLIEVRLFFEPAGATSTRSQHGICSVTQLLAVQRPGRVLLYAAVAA